MKKYKQLLDVVLLAGLGLIALLAIAPKQIVMSTSMQMVIFAVVLGLLAAFLVLYWREQPDDERAVHNQAAASRAAYLVGSLVLIAALVVQGISHTSDPAIPLVLLAMIATKIIVQRVKDGE